MKSPTAITVRVPATSANVGPGFDSLGIALRLYNEVDVQFSTGRDIRLIPPEGATPTSGSIRMANEAALCFFERLGEARRGAVVRIRGEVPIARGLGSSVTARLGIVAGLNALCGNPLNRQGLLDLITELEGHPDNAAPAILGGFVVSAKVGDEVTAYSTKLPTGLKFVAAIPDFEVQTKKARALLPKTLRFSDAVHNVNRVAMLVGAFMKKDYPSIGRYLEDRLHQPYRAVLIPQLFECLNAAVLSGAIGGWLSGSGSTIMAITSGDPLKVGAAMKQVFTRQRIRAQVHVLTADNRGVTVAPAARVIAE